MPSKETQANAGPQPALEISAIQAVLPHRYPFLLVDRILEVDPMKRVVGLKNVTINEPFFAGHFPGRPIMPGVLILEAMAQTGGMLLLNSGKEFSDKLVYFTGIDNAKFRKPVVPGDQLRFEVELLKARQTIFRMAGKAYVEGVLVSEATLTAALMDK